HGRRRAQLHRQGRDRIRLRPGEDRASRRHDRELTRVTAPQIPNLFKVPELKEKILFTLLCLLIYRLGAHIATPGVNVQALADFLKNAGQGTLFSLYDLFAGGVFIMWLGEQITERGIGNGASLLIFFSIVERIWPETLRTIEALRAGSLTATVPA